jgi:hypothetical protein
LNKQVCPMSISPPGGERVICQPGCLPLLRAQLSCGVASKHVDFDGRDVWHLYGDLVLA